MSDLPLSWRMIQLLAIVHRYDAVLSDVKFSLSASANGF
jgi:hypothetical protein